MNETEDKYGNPRKLEIGEKHVMRLMARDRDSDGWAKVSRMVFPVIEQMPSRLFKLERVGDGGRVKLTDEGESVRKAMEWL